MASTRAQQVTEHLDKPTATMTSIQQLFSLEGQTALVTGGTRGIGQAMAIALAEAGADVLLVQVSFAIEFHGEHKPTEPVEKRIEHRDEACY